MSRVTNIILSTGYENDLDKIIDQINAYLIEKGMHTGLVSIDTDTLPRGWYGGSKMLECELFIGAFNYLHLEEFLEHLKSYSWQYPECVQVIYKEQQDDRFSVWNLDSTGDGDE